MGNPLQPNAFDIECLQPGDEERLRALRLRALQDAPTAFDTTVAEALQWSAASWAQQLRDLATFVAVLEGQDVGMVRGAPSTKGDGAAYLISMWVAPEHRRLGVGGALIDAVIAWATGVGAQTLLLDVGEQNEGAIALYRRKGFVRNGKRSTLPAPRQYIHECQMVRSLP